MTEPTEDEIRRVLAEKVMGWIAVDHSLNGLRRWADEYGNIIIRYEDFWNPLRNIEQAMMCAEKCFIYGKLECFFEDEQEPYRFTGKVRHQTGKWVDYGYSKLPAEAIARACYEAAVR